MPGFVGWLWQLKLGFVELSSYLPFSTACCIEVPCSIVPMMVCHASRVIGVSAAIVWERVGFVAENKVGPV